MLAHPFDDTIAAVSTPPGQSGIGIVRLSGPDALSIADRLFRPSGEGCAPSEQASFTTCHGHVVDGEARVDEVLLTVMRAPRTYTTQDVVEVNCHGGIVPIRRTLELALREGARLADPGEFTKRAYYHGRIDLAQAEAVADVINAQTDAAHRAAQHHLAGALSGKIAELRDRLVDVAAVLEASIDFVEDDIDTLDRGELRSRIEGLEQDMRRMLASAQAGRALREGLQVAIAGRPNVGKSSLMNALLNEDRVIVAPQPGTTRDVVEETVNMGGFPVTLADTAGLRDSCDAVERAGVDRARDCIDRADVVLLVLDGSEPMRPEDLALLSDLASPKTLLVINKLDLPRRVSTEDLPDGAEAVSVSALTGQSLEELRQAVVGRVWTGDGPPAAEVIVTNVRHQQAVQRAADALAECLQAEAEGAYDEILAEFLRRALNALGEITGDTAPEDVINHIFATFCIGK